MNNSKESIILIKLGGSVITDKNTPFSVKNKIIDNIIVQILQYREKSSAKIILIHGGGSFGHPMAKKYGIANGKNNSIQDQILGLVETHNSMVKLNSIIVDKCIENGLPVLSLQTSALFEIDNENKVNFEEINQKKITNCIELDIIPILYGDIVFNKRIGFSILSGDVILLELCKTIIKHSISDIIFMIDEDGIIDKNGLIPIIKQGDIDNLQLKKFDEKIDITGGLRFKLIQIKKILELGYQISLINGSKSNYLLRYLTNQDLPHTRFIID